jgi:hypothetical protein
VLGHSPVCGRSGFRRKNPKASACVFRGDTRFEGKIVSAFEPSADVIRKGKASKPNEFGKMVKLQESTMKSTLAAPMTPSCPAIATH